MTQLKKESGVDSTIESNDKAKLSAHEIYSALRKMIIAMEILPGTRVTESQLADYFSVSRTPVRAALHKLESENLLWIKPKQGCFIRNIDLSQISHYYDVRVTLENMVLSELSKQGDSKELRQLSSLWHPDTMSFGVKVTDELKEAEENFHTQLATLSGNSALLNYITDINHRIRGVRLLGWPDQKSVTDTYEQHFRICQLVLNGDLITAQAEMTVHIRNSQEKASQVTLHQLYNNQNVIQFE